MSFETDNYLYRTRDWAIGAKMCLSIPCRGKSCLRSPSRSGCLWAPASLIFSGAICLSIKQLGPEFDHCPPSSAEVRNDWSNTPATRNAVVAWTGTNLPRSLRTDFEVLH